MKGKKFSSSEIGIIGGAGSGESQRIELPKILFPWGAQDVKPFPHFEPDPLVVKGQNGEVILTLSGITASLTSSGVWSFNATWKGGWGETKHTGDTDVFLDFNLKTAKDGAVLATVTGHHDIRCNWSQNITMTGNFDPSIYASVQWIQFAPRQFTVYQC